MVVVVTAVVARTRALIGIVIGAMLWCWLTAIVTYPFCAIEARVPAHTKTFSLSARPAVHTLDLVTQFDVTPQTDVTRATHAAPF